MALTHVQTVGWQINFGNTANQTAKAVLLYPHTKTIQDSYIYHAKLSTPQLRFINNNLIFHVLT